MARPKVAKYGQPFAFHGLSSQGEPLAKVERHFIIFHLFLGGTNVVLDAKQLQGVIVGVDNHI